MEHMRAENDNNPYRRGEAISIVDERALRALRSYFKEEPPYIFVYYGTTKHTCFVTTRSVWSDPLQRRNIPIEVPSSLHEYANYDLSALYAIPTRSVAVSSGPRRV